MRNVLLLLCWFLLAAWNAEARRFTSANCGCSFSVPPGWSVKEIPKSSWQDGKQVASKCNFRLRPAQWPGKFAEGTDVNFGEYAVEVSVEGRAFKSAARDAFFEQIGTLREAWSEPGFEPEKRASDWVLMGRHASRSDASWIRSDGWFGLTGVALVGYYARGGGYRGLGEAYRAVLSTGRWRTAIVLADNPHTSEEFYSVVKSFRFTHNGAASNERLHRTSAP